MSGLSSLSLLVVSGIASGVVDPPYERVQDSMALIAHSDRPSVDNQKLQALLDATEEQGTAWKQQAWCHLMQPNQAPIVRLQGATRLEFPRGDMPTPDCDTTFETRSVSEARETALRDGWEDPEVLMRAYWEGCRLPNAYDWCDKGAVQTRLQEIEPDNAAVWLLELLSAQAEFATDLAPPPDTQRLIARAAEGRYFDLHEHAGAFDAWEAMAAFAEETPPPGYPEEVSTALDELGFDADSADIERYTGEFQVPTLWVDQGSLSEQCVAAHEANDDETLNQCLRIAELMARAPSEAVAKSGRYLAIGLESRRDGSYDATLDAWDIAENNLVFLAFACSQVRLAPSTVMFGHLLMPEGWYVEHLAFYQEHGERAATLKAVQEQYDLFPDLYAFNPVHCARIPMLEGELAEQVAGINRNEGTASALNALAPYFEPLKHVNR